MGFQTPQLRLVDLLKDVGNGTVQLPDFQRSYRWDDERIRDLLVTVLRGHPMGVIMLLDTGNDNVRFKPQPLARVAADAEADSRVLEEPEHMLLDGQQRMTSLYQALTGGGVVGTKDVRGKELTRRYYLDVEMALGGPADQDDAVRSMPENGVLRTNIGRDVVLDVSTRAKQVQRGLMPFTCLFDQSATDWLLEYVGAGNNQAERLDTFKRFNGQVFGRVQNYVIPAIELDKETTKEAVATVFEKVNSGGLELNNFELLTAMYAGDKEYYEAHGDDFRLREDWELTSRVVAEHQVLGGFKETDFLQAVLLLASQARSRVDTEAGKPRPRPVTARGDDTLDLKLSEYLAWAPKVRGALSWVAHFYTSQHIHTSWFVPYRTQTVPLAVLSVILGEQIDTYTVAARIRQWYWCGVLGELYGSTTETRFARDVEQVPVWCMAATGGNPVSLPNTVQDANFFESRLLSLRTKNAAAYKGIYALLMTQHAKDWRLDQLIDHATYLDQQIDIHHIFPRAWCEKNGVNPDHRESIINKTPLAKKTNIGLRGDSPAVYLPRLERETGMASEEVDAILRGHLVDPAKLRRGDFDAFFRARRAALVDLIGAAIGKQVVRDIVEEGGVEHGLEDPSAFETEPDDTADDLVDDAETKHEHIADGAP